MANERIVEVQDDYSIVLPIEVAEHYKLKKGSKLHIIEGKDAIVLMSQEEKNVWERFDKALENFRQAVEEAGGITDDEIEESIRRVRASAKCS